VKSKENRIKIPKNGKRCKTSALENVVPALVLNDERDGVGALRLLTESVMPVNGAPEWGI